MPTPTNDQAIRYLDGWDDELSPLARSGIEEFNKGEYFEQHELLEEAWLEEHRDIREMYQGILQIGVAFYHLQRGNWSGAVKLLRRGLPKLDGLPPICQGIEAGRLYHESEAIYRELLTLGPERVGDVEIERAPHIHFTVAT